MQPWATPADGAAPGILDDETYDWRAVSAGMFASAGFPVVVADATILEANSLALHSTDIDVSPTGSAGLAGLLHLARQEPLTPGDHAVLLFTGASE